MVASPLAARRTLVNESFLLLFFKKEALACLHPIGKSIPTADNNNNPFNASTATVAAMAVTLRPRPLAKLPITAGSLVRITRAIIGTGKVRLSTIWLATSPSYSWG